MGLNRRVIRLVRLVGDRSDWSPRRRLWVLRAVLWYARVRISALAISIMLSGAWETVRIVARLLAAAPRGLPALGGVLGETVACREVHKAVAEMDWEHVAHLATPGVPLDVAFGGQTMREVASRYPAEMVRGFRERAREVLDETRPHLMTALAAQSSDG